jgi:glutathione peroxidase
MTIEINKQLHPRSLFDFNAKTIQGQDSSLAIYQGSVILVVNVASQCLFTGQYTQLQVLYEKFRDRGFVILGFPCNQFFGQESKSESKIESFCSLKYNVSFPMFSKVLVNGSDTHPIYVFLKSQATGWFGSEAIKWNFTKFLVGRDGQVLSRYSPTTSPRRLQQAIERALDVTQLDSAK